MVSANITAVLSSYITALHILHNRGVLDGYGHISVRNPANSSNFFMMHQLAPALVSRRNDIGEYRVSDAEPVDSSIPAGPMERFIHNELLKQYPDVNVVLHGHPSALVSYGISHVPLRAVNHMTPFLGTNVPVFDITKHYLPNDKQDFLVRNQRQGAALADQFGSSTRQDYSSVDETATGSSRYPSHNLVLMRSHGFTAVAKDIKVVTFEGVYAVVNAEIQSEALKLHQAYAGMNYGAGKDGLTYLNEGQVQDSWETEIELVGKTWDLWEREVKLNPLYVNELDSGK
ncbi:class II aldolase and Adducin N-terminal domain-containing protein [Chaetomium sp. MPI-SDFR-AT-0129]|nr:class II aldolase and Adducin N-terminal domain-containing protein [Chaetomium sp. MPI-SDFR-AT-0129]